MSENGQDSVAEDELAGESRRVRFRRATFEADAHRLLEWRNDPAVRAASVNCDEISWEAHEAWLRRRLADHEGTVLLVAELVDEDATPIGTVRLDVQRERRELEVSFCLSAAFRGRGLGSSLLREALLFAAPLELGLTSAEAARWRVVGLVRPENAPSLAAFARLGFTRDVDLKVEQPNGDGAAEVALVHFHRALLPATAVQRVEGQPLVVGIVQARMGSSRLPGKVLKTYPVVGDDGVVRERANLAVMWARLQQARSVDQWVVATTTREQDDSIARWCALHDVACTRGSSDDVLDRYAQTARVAVSPKAARDGAAVVRVTSDCPIIDPAEVDRVVGAFWATRRADNGLTAYVSNIGSPRAKRNVPSGLDVEVFAYAALMNAARSATTKHDREHVTPFLRNAVDPPAGDAQYPIDLSHFRWTLDTRDDYDMLRRTVLACSQGAYRARAGATAAAAAAATAAAEKEDAVLPPAPEFDASDAALAALVIPTDETLRFPTQAIHEFLMAHPEVQAICLKLCSRTDCTMRLADTLCNACGAVAAETGLCFEHAGQLAEERGWDVSMVGKVRLPKCSKCPPA